MNHDINYVICFQATNDSIKVCVIGAGAAGLCVARHFSRLSQLFTVDIIEQAANIGDTWATNFQQHEANTQYALLLYNSMFTIQFLFQG